jgi:asparagine synthase (glutamine-hydrolysing)
VSGPFLLRWDTRAEARPALVRARGRAALDPPARGFAVLDGHLFDRAELALGPAGSDAALLAAAWERWSDALWDKLRGSFAAAIWDEGERRLALGRDAMGATPCFYTWDGRVFAASPSLDLLLAERGAAPAFDRVVVAEYLQGSDLSPRPHETFYRDVRRIPPAHALSVRPRRLEVSRYWDPLPPGFAWAGADELERFEPVLERAVGRCLAAGADSIALSGGFDSVSIATLAAEQRGDGPALHALSLRFTDTPCDEGETQVAVARALGLPQLVMTTEEALGGESAAAAALGLSAMLPSPVLSPWQSVYTGLFRRAAGLGLGRLLMGTGGDDVLNVDRSHGADRLAALDVRGLWRFFRATARTSPFSTCRVARGVLWDGAMVPELRRIARGALAAVSPGALEALRRRRRRAARPEWLSIRDREIGDALESRQLHPALPPLAPGERSYVLAIRQLAQAPLFLLEQDQVHAWTRRFGFALLMPYFDRDLVELSLRMPPEHLIAGGRHKSPLRRLVASRLPSVPMRARKVNFTQAVHGALRPHGLGAWRALGGPRMLADLGLVDAGRLDRYVREYFEGRHAHWRRVWIAITTEAWLRARAAAQLTSRAQEVPQ